MLAAADRRLDTVRRGAARRLRSAAIESPDLDARLLLGHALGLDHTGLASASERTLDAAEIAHFDMLLARRLRHEPVARIIGTKEFWGLPFAVTSAVFVPRPETETVVETALAALSRAGRRVGALRIADLGTGSGAIMLALLAELPRACAIGTDSDPAALAIARANARDLGLADRAWFVACDFGSALPGGFDLVVTNPPYVVSAEIETLAPDVALYDPRGALDGGPDGLAAYRAIAADAARLLAPGAHFVAEIGIGQVEAVRELLAEQPLEHIAVVPDLAGTPRVLLASRCR